MLAKATGVEAPEQKGLESFIPARAGDEPVKETPDDIMAKGANWLSDIKKASYEFKKAYEELRSKKAVDSPATAFVKGLSESVAKKKEAQREELTVEERKDAFVKRRGDRPSTYGPGTKGFADPVPINANVKNALDALAAVESRGSGDYAAKGPVVQKGMYKGQRALGRYQVMEGNIPSWSKAALGHTITVDEFMAEPKYQDAIAGHQMQNSKDKYGTWEDAASVWFTGRPISKSKNASDGYLSAPAYLEKFRKAFVR